eukprot:3566728-Prymnesium_polylepis.1
MPSSCAAIKSIEPRLVPRRTSVSFCSCGDAPAARHASKNSFDTLCAETTIVVALSGRAELAKNSGSTWSWKTTLLPREAAASDLNVWAQGAIHTTA